MSDHFFLLGHLQVLEEPLLSLYIERESGLMYLFVRLFEKDNVNTYLLSEVTAQQVVDYMERRLGLKGIIEHGKPYYYRKDGTILTKKEFQPLSKKLAYKKLGEDGLEDLFDRQLSYRPIPLKQYLKELVKL